MSMTKSIRNTLLLGLFSVAVSIPGAASAQIKNLDLTTIRAYADGNMHLMFRGDVTPACGGVIRVSGNGKDSVRTLALAALMSGRAVTLEVTPQKIGNFCNLIFIRLDE
jgi:hypothetical protein